MEFQVVIRILPKEGKVSLELFRIRGMDVSAPNPLGQNRAVFRVSADNERG